MVKPGAWLLLSLSICPLNWCFFGPTFFGFAYQLEVFWQLLREIELQRQSIYPLHHLQGISPLYDEVCNNHPRNAPLFRPLQPQIWERFPERIPEIPHCDCQTSAELDHILPLPQRGLCFTGGLAGSAQNPRRPLLNRYSAS